MDARIFQRGIDARTHTLNETARTTGPANQSTRADEVHDDSLPDESAERYRFHIEPFPCEHKDCKTFHADDTTGLCSKHGGGVVGGSGDSPARCGWVPPLSVMRARWKVLAEKGHIALLTGVMAVLETDSKLVISLFSACALVILCLEVYGIDGEGTAGLVAVLLMFTFLFLSMWRTSYVLEGMERSCQAYDAAFEEEVSQSSKNQRGEPRDDLEEGTIGHTCTMIHVSVTVPPDRPPGSVLDVEAVVSGTSYRVQVTVPEGSEAGDTFIVQFMAAQPDHRGMHEDIANQSSSRTDCDAMFGPKPRLNEGLRQPTELDFRELYVACRRNHAGLEGIMKELSVAGRANGDDARKIRGPGMKGTRRAKEKMRLDYDGDCSQLKDILRGTIYCDTLEDICVVWSEIEALQSKGVVVIELVKNRFHPTSTSLAGYRDINSILRINSGSKGSGILCELQLILTPFIVLKHESHPSYEIARSLGLVGPLPGLGSQQSEQPAGTVPLLVRLELGLLRFAAIVVSLFFGTWYLLSYTIYFKEYMYLERDVGDATYRAFATIATATPFYAVIWLLWVDSGCCYSCCGCCRCWGKPRRKQSRTALLYNKYFGLKGELFGWKVLATQSATVLLQAFTKLPLLSAMTGQHGAVDKKIFWFFLATLVVNCLYPCLLLRDPFALSGQDQIWAKRAAMCDAACDIIYLIASIFLAFRFRVQGYLFGQMGVIPYLSNSSPLFHIWSLARAIEHDWRTDAISSPSANSNTAEEPESEPSGAALGVDLHGRQLLPYRTLAGYSVCTLSFVAAALFGTCRSGYPFNEYNNCFPCKCKTVDGSRSMWTCGYDDPPIPVGARNAFDLYSLDVYSSSLMFKSSTKLDVVDWDTVLPTDTFQSFKVFEVYSTAVHGSLPTELGFFGGNLYEFYMNDNKLTGALPTELGALSRNLGSLWLNHNRLSGTLPSEIGALTNAVSLVLKTNGLAGSLPTELGRLTKTPHLSLSSNKFCGDIPTELSALTRKNFGKMDHFRIKGNSIGTACSIDTT